MITIQYLEASPELAGLDVRSVVDRLIAAHDKLPITHLLVGWEVPQSLLEACRTEAERLGIRFLRWHPLLTGDGIFQPRPEWQVENALGQKVPGFRGMPEFTFVCPNHPEVRAAVQEHIKDLLGEGRYQGFFLDRIRFPSPAEGLLDGVGCFCVHCREKSRGFDLDLEEVKQDILRIAKYPGGYLRLVELVLGASSAVQTDPELERLRLFLEFRMRSITDFVSGITGVLRAAGMEIGLDSFAPSLIRMVGQDLVGLSRCADWIKVMCYAHTLGPAGLPFELLGLYHQLMRDESTTETVALETLSRAAEIPLPAAQRGLEQDGLSPAALEKEVRRGISSSAIPVLAGIELVEIAGVTNLNQNQIREDLKAIRRTGAAGLSLSWDLRYIPLDRLDIVRENM